MSIKSKTFSVFMLALLCAGILRTFVVEGFLVRGDSMSPAIVSGDYVFIYKLAYFNSGEPERGDIVVVKPRGSNQKILKRIIGLPGERFSIEEGKIVIREERTDEGVIIEESYASGQDTEATGLSLIKLDPQEYFALGDNRAVSVDSRELGPVDKWDIKGKVIGIFNLSSFKFKKF